jgi:hydrogenase maturation protease
MRIAVLGVGARLRGDDAVGLVAVERWRAEHPDTAGRSEITVQLLELPGLALLEAMKDCQKALIVDALAADSPPGTIYTLIEADLAGFQPGSGSAHGWGLAETLQLGRRLDPDTLPDEIAILAIQGAAYTTGADLSPSVESKLSDLVGAIETTICSWISLA